MIVLTRISLINLKNNRMDKLEYIPGDLAFHYIPKTTIKKYVKVYVCSTNNALSLEDMDGNLYDYIGELYPIPLTPEILEKNGWKKFKRPYSSDYCYRRKGYPTLNIRSEKEVYFHWGDQDESITTVHQLQHLLFGLGINHEMEV